MTSHSAHITCPIPQAPARTLYPYGRGTAQYGAFVHYGALPRNRLLINWGKGFCPTLTFDQWDFWLTRVYTLSRGLCRTWTFCFTQLGASAQHGISDEHVDSAQPEASRVSIQSGVFPQQSGCPKQGLWLLPNTIFLFMISSDMKPHPILGFSSTWGLT